MKRRILCVIISICLFGTGLLSGCNKENNDSRLPEPTQIVLNSENIALNVGEQFELRVADEELFWNEAVYSSSDTSVATVDNNGLITANKQGQSTITVSFGDRSTTSVVTVSAVQESYSMFLDKKDMTIGVGSTVSVVATVMLGETVISDSVVWSVTDEECEVETQSNGNTLQVKVLTKGFCIITATFKDIHQSIKVTAIDTDDFMEYPTEQEATLEEMFAIGFKDKGTNWAEKDYLSLWRLMTAEEDSTINTSTLTYTTTNGITATDSGKGDVKNVGLVFSSDALKAAVNAGNTHVTVTWNSKNNSHTVINGSTLNGVKTATKTFVLADLKVGEEYLLKINTKGAWHTSALYISSLVFENPMETLFEEALIDGVELAAEKYIPLWNVVSGAGILTAGSVVFNDVTYGEGLNGICFKNKVEAYLSHEFIAAAVNAGYKTITLKMVVPATTSSWWFNSAVFDKTKEVGTANYGKKVIISGAGYTTEKTATVNIADILCDGEGYFTSNYINKYCLKVWTANAGTCGYLTSLKLGK